jgi:hypothetical protein
MNQMQLLPDSVYINGCPIGYGHRSYIVGNVSCNYNSYINRTYRLIGAARNTGANALKIISQIQSQQITIAQNLLFLVVRGMGDDHHFGVMWKKKIRVAGLRLLILDDYGYCNHYHAYVMLNQDAGAQPLPTPT